MVMIAFRSDDELKKQLEAIAENKGINLSALIKLYLTRAVKEDLQETTFEGNTVAEELKEAEKEARAVLPALSGGTEYHSAEELIASLEQEGTEEANSSPGPHPPHPPHPPRPTGRRGLAE